MNHDLGRALQDLANAGADQASPATLLAGHATNRVAARHRRRRVAVSAITIVGVAAVGTGTAAAISYFSDERVSTFPDRPVSSVQAPVSPTGLVCDGEVGDLDASTTPLVLGNEMALEAGNTPVLVNVETGSMIPMFLTGTTAEDLDVTLAEGSGVYLVQDGKVIAVPVRTDATPTDATITPGVIHPLLNDRVVACDPAVGIPGGDYQAYGSIKATVPEGAFAGTYDVVGGPWNVVVEQADGTVVDPSRQLPAADPAAEFPQCGSTLVAADQAPPVHLSLVDSAPETTGEQSSVPLLVDATNVMSEHLLGSAGKVTLVMVQDGVVVGTVSTIETDEGGPVDLDQTESLTTATRLDYTSCSPEAVYPKWLPPGEYSIWGSQSFTLTQRTPVAPDGTRGTPTPVGEQVTAFNEVAMIAIEEGGQPVFPSGS